MMSFFELGIKLDIIELVIFETCWIFVDLVTIVFIESTETMTCVLISLQKTFT